MSEVVVSEVFESIQGESTYAGLPCFFIRLAGCNLRCAYCDTEYAQEHGTPTNIEALIDQAARAHTALVEITGGEPLLQPQFTTLAKGLLERSGKKVLVETNGSCDISAIPDGVVAIVDVKCPGSGEQKSFDADNLDRLRPYDEVKFVLSARYDYEWARTFVQNQDLHARCGAVLFAPVHGVLDLKELAEWILEDGLDVRLQVQLHKVMGLR